MKNVLIGTATAPMRVAAYLAATLGPSGDDLCGAPAAEKKRIDHVVLSHPHLDHASALDLVLHCYDVAQFWDSGRVNDTVFYRELLSGIAQAALASGVPYFSVWIMVVTTPFTDSRSTR